VTGQGELAQLQEATRATPELARRLATALAGEIEGDQWTVLDFARWVAGDPARVHALAIVADLAVQAANWTPDDLRTFAAAQEAVTQRRPR